MSLNESTITLIVKNWTFHTHKRVNLLPKELLHLILKHFKRIIFDIFSNDKYIIQNECQFQSIKIFCKNENPFFLITHSNEITPLNCQIMLQFEILNKDNATNIAVGCATNLHNHVSENVFAGYINKSSDLYPSFNSIGCKGVSHWFKDEYAYFTGKDRVMYALIN